MLPTGMAGLRYPITQVSLAVEDLDTTMASYHQTFGWAPWQVFDHVQPVHHDTELRGAPVHYALRGAEVYVGSLNFELLEPLAGPNLWSEFMDRRGEGIASIATMFHEREDGDAVKVAFRERFGADVIMRADIGDHIEYYYLDTEDAFGCLIESGSGHAIDFVKPASVYPHVGAVPGPSPISGISYPISGISLSVRDLDRRLRNFHEAFGWGPWRIFESDGANVLHHSEYHGRPADFRLRWAETTVGDIGFELVESLGGSNPFGDFVNRNGEGISGISLTFPRASDVDRVVTQLAAQGIGLVARARVGDDAAWFLADTEPLFKCAIRVGGGRPSARLAVAHYP
jgi:hypothetical protein